MRLRSSVQYYAIAHIFMLRSPVHYFPTYYQFYTLKISALQCNILYTHLHCEVPCITLLPCEIRPPLNKDQCLFVSPIETYM